MTDSNKLPNFIVIGAAKSGTTTLYHHLRAHPDVFMPEFKEPHYFVSDQNLNFDVIEDEDSYQALFEDAAQALRGEASTGYLYFSDTAKKIKKSIPDCKIIALVRDPSARAFSMWGHQIREGLEELTFDDAIQEELNGNTRLNNNVEYGFNYCKLGMTSELLLDYQKQFGKTNVFIGDYEMLRTNPQELMNQIYHFLGVKSIVQTQLQKRYNASGKPKFARLHSFLNSKSTLRSAITYPFKRLLGKRFTHSIWQTLRNYNINSGSRHEMSKNAQMLLDNYFAEEREKLRILIHSD